MEETKELIETVLRKDQQDIDFEPIPEENDSPLSQPVVEKSSAPEDTSASQNESNSTTHTAGNKEEPKVKPKEQPTDAPEQEINAEQGEGIKKEDEPGKEEEGFAIPLKHAGLMADSIIGTINNTVLEVGGGFFVTIRKHKDFYDFEEVIQVIDEQNVKNIKRLKLDEEDKALLRPLLIHILRKKAEALTPEKQLLMVALSILIKKAKVVVEIRAENEMLVERIRDIIRKEIRESKDEKAQEQEKKKQQTVSEIKTEKEKEETAQVIYGEVVQNPTETNCTGLPGSVLETFE